ncbi:MAG TPA: alanine dehydrogenase [Bacteroidota bacterium]|nr:alanine dehydrogenase [Bacteroidota bacterium]
MIIGVLKEKYPSERRVSQTPGGVQSLVSLGATLYVEHNAGTLSFFSDEEYQHAGATIAYSAEEVINRSDIVLKVAPPLEKELEMLRDGQTLFSAFHLPIAKRSTIETLLQKKITAIGHELIENQRGELPIVQTMSEIAGQISIQVAAYYLQTQHGGRGVLLGSIPGIHAANVVILGAGTVGRTAARVALGLGAKVTVLDKNIPRLREIENLFQWRISTVISDPYTIARESREADALIGAVLLKGERTPHIVTEEMVKHMRPGSVIVDVSIDHGGCVETSRPTTLMDPIFVEHKVVHYCVPNIPASVPRTATVGWTNVLLPFLREATELGMEQVLRADVGLSHGVCTFDGKCTNAAAAKAFDIPYVDIDQLLKR